MKTSPTPASLIVGIGWAAATVSTSVATCTPKSGFREVATREVAERFFEILFRKRCCRSAFEQYVDPERFDGHLADDACTASQAIPLLQAFVDASARLAIKGLAASAEHAFARVERISTNDSRPRQHLIQLTISAGKVVGYLGSLRS